MKDCKYCHQIRKTDEGGRFFEWDNSIGVAEGDYTILRIGVDEQGKIRLAAYGEDEAYYYPNYCPVCGRKLKGENDGL